MGSGELSGKPTDMQGLPCILRLIQRGAVILPVGIRSGWVGHLAKEQTQLLHGIHLKYENVIFLSLFSCAFSFYQI